MKHIIVGIFSLFYFGCSKHLSEPKFLLYQKVIFPVTKFYSKSCSGKGYIEQLNQLTDGNEYAVEDAEAIGCPIQFFWEKDLKATE